MYLNKTNLFLAISVCLIFFFLTYFDVKSNEIKIIDGDTIHLNGEKIRFSGIDTPEIKQTCANLGTVTWQLFHFLSAINTLFLNILSNSSGIWTTVDGINNDFRSSDCSWINSRTSPPNVYRQPCEIDNCPIPTVATQIES